MHHTFKVTPIGHYGDARYPSHQHIDSVDELAEETGLLRRVSALVLCIFPLVFLATCYRQSAPAPATVVQTPVVVQTPTVVQTPVVVQRPPRIVVVRSVAQCSTNDRRCRDQQTLETCHGGAWVARSCEEYCRQNNGPDSYSQGCNVAAADPCQCTEDYGMIDGLMDDVYKGDL